METQLYSKVQNNSIIEIFMPLIKKYSKALNFDGADTVLNNITNKYN